ncbi:MAG: hypothetical protein AAFX06_33920 [Planctomycetota bacterium]
MVKEVTESARQIFETLQWVRAGARFVMRSDELHQSRLARNQPSKLAVSVSEQAARSVLGFKQIAQARHKLREGILHRLPELSAAVQRACLPHPAAIPIEKTCAHEYAIEVAGWAICEFSREMLEGSDWLPPDDVQHIIPLNDFDRLADSLSRTDDDDNGRFVLQCVVNAIDPDIQYTLLAGLVNQEGGAFLNYGLQESESLNADDAERKTKDAALAIWQSGGTWKDVAEKLGRETDSKGVDATKQEIRRYAESQGITLRIGKPGAPKKSD